jgi:hypothetical protein
MLSEHYCSFAATSAARRGFAKIRRGRSPKWNREDGVENLIVQHYVKQRTVDLQTAVVMDEA